MKDVRFRVDLVSLVPHLSNYSVAFYRDEYSAIVNIVLFVFDTILLLEFYG